MTCFGLATIAGVIGTILSFLLVGYVAVAGKRGSALTMVLSRAAFGVRNRLPAGLPWILCVGWETVIAALAVEASATVKRRCGEDYCLNSCRRPHCWWGCYGFDVLMRIQRYITVITGILTVGKVNWAAVMAVKGATSKPSWVDSS